jgi:hypothetical protein
MFHPYEGAGLMCPTPANVGEGGVSENEDVSVSGLSLEIWRVRPVGRLARYAWWGSEDDSDDPYPGCCRS